MQIEKVVYRNRRWSLRLAPYMCFRGVALVGAPISLALLIPLKAATPLLVVALVIVLTGGWPLVRTLRGQLSVDTSGNLQVRNPFRTIALPLDSICGFGDVFLQQGFFSVAALQDRSGRIHKIVPVPGTDGPLLESLVNELQQA